MHDGPKDSPANVGTSHRGSRRGGQSNTVMKINRVQRSISPFQLSAFAGWELNSVGWSSQVLCTNSLELMGLSDAGCDALSLVPWKRPDVPQLLPAQPQLWAGVRHTWISHRLLQSPPADLPRGSQSLCPHNNITIWILQVLRGSQCM